MAKITVEYLRKEIGLTQSLSDEALEYIARKINEKASEPEWIRVEDRLPNEGQEVLFFNERIYNMKGEPYSSDVHCGFHFKGYFKTWLSQDKMKATHWMPLPNKPN